MLTTGDELRILVDESIDALLAIAFRRNIEELFTGHPITPPDKYDDQYIKFARADALGSFHQTWKCAFLIYKSLSNEKTSGKRMSIIEWTD
jgi:hypothetical protein